MQLYAVSMFLAHARLGDFVSKVNSFLIVPIHVFLRKVQSPLQGHQWNPLSLGFHRHRADFGWHCSHPVVPAGYHMLGLCHSVAASSTVRSRTVITDHLWDFKLLQQNTPRMELKLMLLTLCCGENFSDWLCYALKGYCHQNEQNYFLWVFTLC